MQDGLNQFETNHLGPETNVALEEHSHFLASEYFFFILPDVQPEMFHKPPLSEPDVIVIDPDERKRDVFPHLETAEGKQASSMLRRLASAGNSKPCVFQIYVQLIYAQLHRERLPRNLL